MATVQIIGGKNTYKRKRVAAYARVSTRKENQDDSIETQMKYYEMLIKSNSNWTFTKVYSDHGFSGVSAEKRPGFMQMVKEAKWKEFDILLVRSISRFARNVREAQIYCRELKKCGIEVRFEREQISSTNQTAEMAFNLLASCAQEESRSISERTKWSIYKLQEQGILHIGNKALGYDELDGVLTPNNDAYLVKEIFTRYAEGERMTAIAKNLNQREVCREKSNHQLTRSHICYILQNPIYVGDRFLQKQAPKNYMTHKPDWKQAYVSYRFKDTHVGIVDRVLWDEVQGRLAREKALLEAGIKVRQDSHFLYGKVFCGACGFPMKRKLVYSGEGKIAVWKCADRMKGKQGNGCKNDIWKENALLEMIFAGLKIDAKTQEACVAELGRRVAEIDKIIVTGKNIEVVSITV